jgi:hypothetical protein
MAAPPDVENANAVGDEASQHLNDMGQQQSGQDMQNFIHSWTMKKDPNDPAAPPVITATFDSRLADHIQKELEIAQQTRQAYQGAIQRIAAQRQFLEQNPGISALGRIASQAATNYQFGGPRAGPVIHAMGAFGADTFGQTPTQLATQEAGLRTQELQAMSPVTQALHSQAQLNIQQEHMGLERQKVGVEMAALGVKQNNETLQRIQHVDDKHMKMAEDGAVTPELYQQDLVEAGMKPEDAKKKADQMAKIGPQVFANKQALINAKSEGDMKKFGMMLTARESMLTQRENFAMNKAMVENYIRLADVGMKNNPKERATLEGITASENSINDLQRTLTDPKKASAVGPIAGRLAKVMQGAGVNDKDWAEVVQKFKLQVPIDVGLFGEGANGFRVKLLEFNASLAPNEKYNLNQTAGIIAAMRALYSQKRMAIAPAISTNAIEAHPDLWGGRDHTDFSKAKSKAADYSGMANMMGPAVQNFASGKGATESTVPGKTMATPAGQATPVESGGAKPPKLTGDDLAFVKKAPKGHYAKVGNWLYDSEGNPVKQAQ